MIMKDLLRVSGRWAPGGAPGVYVARVARGAERLRQDRRVASVTESNGYVTITLTHDALARVALDITPDCVSSQALQGVTVPGATVADLVSAPDWEAARAALAAELTAELAQAAGATVSTAPQAGGVGWGSDIRFIKKAVEFAGADAVRFAVASMRPGGAPPDPERTARPVLGNPAYAVRYAHAAAAAVLRWAGSGPEPGTAAGFRPSRLAEPGELALLDALSWLPERVAVAARRGRPDEFARYLATLATTTIDTMSTTGFTAGPAVTIERLWLARAARTGLGAGLRLLGIAAPDRL
jgi:hypothetical protein